MLSFDFSRPSILRNMFLAFMAFGFAMGIVFPVFANLFVEWKDGMLVWFIISCIVAGISIGLVNFWLLNKMLLQRLKRIGEVANAISNNDVSHECSLKSDDFIGDMAESFNLMSHNLRSMIQRINDVSLALNNASSEMASEIQGTKEGVEQQKKATENVAVAMNTMHQSVLAMANHAQAALQSVNDANTATDKGAKVVTNTVASISLLAQQVEDSTSVIKRLAKDSATIGSVLSVIKDIAEQINLLALNAAIEAARAGEHGRGFAVVADEVRILASRTQESTKQIEVTIEDLQLATKEAVKVMKSGREKAHESVGQANEAGASLKAIESSVSTIFQMNTDIASASEQQRQQATLVNSNVEDISQVAQKVAFGADKTSETSSQLRSIASQLSQLIGQFKT